MSWLVWLPAYLEPRVLGWCGYLHTLKLVSWLVFALCFAGNFFRPCKARALLVGSGYLHTLNLVSLLVCVLVGSDYLHTLNLVSLVGVSLVRVLVGVVTCIP